VLTAVGRLFFGSPSGDFHCGLRGFDRDAILALDLQAPGMEFASEMVVKATLRKLRITEVPTILHPDGRSRPPHLRSWRDGWRHLRFLLLFSPAWLFFYPGLLLLVAGAATMAWLLPSERLAGRIVFDVNTLVFAAAAIVCGFQAMIFYVFAKTHAIRHGLLPEDHTVARLREILSLEVGVVVGLVIFVGGLLLATNALHYWGAASFGNLDPSRSLRMVVPSATLLIVGLQFIFSSCLLAVLQLDVPDKAARSADPSQGASRPEHQQRIERIGQQ
jgi:hypothetical protein